MGAIQKQRPKDVPPQAHSEEYHSLLLRCRPAAAFVLICCFLLWGPLEMLPLALAARPPRADAPVAKVACVCRMCAAHRSNPHACCCAKAHSSAETLVMQAQCEDQHTTMLVAKAYHPLTLPNRFAPPAICGIFTFNHVFHYTSTLRVLTPEPSEPPPCHA